MGLVVDVSIVSTLRSSRKQEILLSIKQKQFTKRLLKLNMFSLKTLKLTKMDAIVLKAVKITTVDVKR